MLPTPQRSHAHPHCRPVCPPLLRAARLWPYVARSRPACLGNFFYSRRRFARPVPSLSPSSDPLLSLQEYSFATPCVVPLFLAAPMRWLPLPPSSRLPLEELRGSRMSVHLLVTPLTSLLWPLWPQSQTSSIA